ncbi:MAG: hypothetical protein Fur0046_12450 [Cyanobacteria bacterium J069]|nr:MAG: hypothetical protein D6742_00610 [Cyanobacteria bacterium J069]
MDCLKDRGVQLVEVVLRGNLPALRCPECEGCWIAPEAYIPWQQQQPQPLPETVNLEAGAAHRPALMDARTALCPDCRGFLSRVKTGETMNPFYIERCPQCGGIWCDRGEWETLTAMGISAIIDQLFSSDWQSRMRARELLQRERTAMIDKLGEDLAAQVFALADQLEPHPNGDFGVAYLMRRVRGGTE